MEFCNRHALDTISYSCALVITLSALFSSYSFEQFSHGGVCRSRRNLGPAAAAAQKIATLVWPQTATWGFFNLVSESNSDTVFARLSPVTIDDSKHNNEAITTLVFFNRVWISILQLQFFLFNEETTLSNETKIRDSLFVQHFIRSTVYRDRALWENFSLNYHVILLRV